jgi:hypothetical protein
MAEERRPRQRIREFFGLDPSTAPARPAREPTGQGLRSPRARENLREMAQGVEDRNTEPRRPREILTGRRAAPAEDTTLRDEAIRRMPPNDMMEFRTGPMQDMPPAPGPRREGPMQGPPRPQGRRRTAPQAESMSADDLNEISLRLARGATPNTDTEKRLARAMGLNFKKGGLVDSKKGAPTFAKGVPPQFGKGKAPPTPGKGPPNMFKKKGK